MARHSSRCLLFAFQLRRSGVEVAKWFVCEKTYLAECGRSEDLIRKTTNRSAAPKRRGKNFKFYALLYFQDNDSIIKNSICIPFSKVRNHAYDFDVIESGIWEKKNLFAHLMYINYA